jgi:hypothetical protein
MSAHVPTAHPTRAADTGDGEQAVLQWLCDHAGHLTTIYHLGEGARDIMRAALRAGAFPNLKKVRTPQGRFL